MATDLVAQLEQALAKLQVDDESCAPSGFADVCAAANRCRDIRIAWEFPPEVIQDLGLTGLGERATDLLLHMLVWSTEMMLTTYEAKTVLDGRNTGLVRVWRAVWDLWRERAAA